MKASVKTALWIAGGVIAAGAIALVIKGQIDKNSDKGGKRGKNGDDKDAPVDESKKNLINKTVKVHKGLGYTNVRSTPKVDTGYSGGLFGVEIGGNKIGKVESNPLGTIGRVITGEDGYTWYVIKLAKPLDGKRGGFVREDAVSF